MPSDLTYDLRHSAPAALRDDLSAARWELRMLTEVYRACFDTLCDAATEIERQRRMIAELREERERYAREIFGE